MPDLSNLPAFVAGQRITHSVLNDAFSGLAISTSWHTSKSTASSFPGTLEFTVYDPASTSYKKGSLTALVLTNDELVYNRTNNDTPGTDAIFLNQNPTTKAFYKTARNKLFDGLFGFTGVLATSSGLTHTSGNGLAVYPDDATIQIDATSHKVQLKDGGTELAKLSTTAKRSLAGAMARFSRQVASGTTGETANTSTLTALALNTTETNTLTGASLNTGTGVITVAAGRYEVELNVPASNTAGAQVELYDTGTGTVVSSVDSIPVRATGYAYFQYPLTHSAVVSFASSTTLGLRAKAGSAGTWGYPASQGVPEHYQTITLRQAY